MTAWDDADLVRETATRLHLARCGATRSELLELETRVGVRLPALVRAFLSKFAGAANSDVEFAGEPVLLDSADEMLRIIDTCEIEGRGLLPFAHDFFGSIWFVSLLPASDGTVAGRVVLVPVQDRYTNAEQPVEPKAASFRDFLLALGTAPS